ncbi:MAG: hypothetical protein Q7S51_10270 [Gallionellaceae bacterium]|nr:hypothetical protein [Gallionellaceae bacterium]
MNATCPACGATMSLDVIIGHEGARAAVMIALKFPAPLGNLLVQYLALFRPATRQLSFDRVSNLLNELLPMIEAGKVTRSGRIWSAPQDYWKLALEDMLTKRDKLTLPLKGHGYLLAIIEGYGNKAEARQEAQTEARRGGRTCSPTLSPAPLPLAGEGGQRPGEGAKPKPRSIMPPSVMAVLKRGGINNGHS